MKKIHRFFYNFRVIGDFINIDDLEIVNQIRNVLKLATGEDIILFFDNKEAHCQIDSTSKKFVNCRIVSDIKTFVPENEIALFCAVLKKDNFELVVQKVSEVGVSRIIPVITERTIKTNLNFDRLNKIAQEACEQSERSSIVSVSDIKNFKDCLKSDFDFNILFDFSGEDFNNLKLKNKDLVIALEKNDKSIAFFIGPEGGFTDKEVKLAIDNGFIIARLGKNVLRGETAAIIASYLLIN